MGQECARKKLRCDSNKPVITKDGTSIRQVHNISVVLNGFVEQNQEQVF